MAQFYNHSQNDDAQASIFQLAIAGGGVSSGGGHSSHSSYSGSSSSSGGGESSGSFGFALFIIIGFIVFIFILALISKIFDKKKKEKLSGIMASSGLNYDDVNGQIVECIKRYNQDWSNFNVANFPDYLTANYSAHATLLMVVLRSLGRVNQVNVKNVESTIESVAPSGSTTTIQARCRVQYDEILTDGADQKVVSASKNGEAVQKYNFVVQGGKVYLDSILPVQYSYDSESIMNFARSHGGYYQPDMGNLFLPINAEMFNGLSFDTVDINNHVVGTFGDIADPNSKWYDPNMVYQIYTLDQIVNNNETSYGDTRKDDDNQIMFANQTVNKLLSNKYVGRKVVGQLTLPRQLGRIIVTVKKGALAGVLNKMRFKFGQLEKIELESVDFNRLYDVYVTPGDRVSVLEVLNPKTMQYLIDNPDRFNLEVTGNAIYAYVDAGANLKAEQNYDGLLKFLQTAHGELRM